MSIHFDRISITNFGPYYGTNHLEFSPSKDCPVTLLYGENTFGKSQLFAAFRWVLYGTLGSDTKQKAKIQELSTRFNRKAQSEGKEAMEIALAFKSDGREYRITRSYNSKTLKSKTSLKIDTSIVAPSNIESEINRLLHPEISQFFLFDGEMLSEFFDHFDDNYSRQLIKEQIEKVIGVPALTGLSADISHLLNRMSAVMNKSDHASRQISLNTKKRDKSLYECRSLAEQIKLIYEMRSAAQTRKKELDTDFARLPEIQDDFGQLNRLEAEREAIASQQKRLVEELQAAVSTSWFRPAISTLQRDHSRLKAAQERHSENAQQLTLLETELRNHVHTNMVGSCPTCGHVREPITVQEIDDVKARIAKLKLEIYPFDLSKYGRIHTALSSVSTDAYGELAKKSLRLVREAQKLDGEIVSLTERLKEYDNSQVKLLAEEHSTQSSIIARSDQTLPTLEADLKAHQATVATLDKKIAQLSRGSASKREQLEHQILMTLDSLVGEAVDDFKVKTRNSVEGLTSKIFMELIHDPDAYKNITISPDYQMHLNSNLRDDASTSEGGRQLLALSFISALKQVAISEGPVVIDSPLGRLDLTHRQRVLEKWIPSLGGQALLLVQSGELERESAREWLQGLIYNEYEIARPTSEPEHAELRKVN